jgi:uncharacterized protein (DUF1684 family)
MEILNTIKQAFTTDKAPEGAHNHDRSAEVEKNLSPEIYIANLEAQRAEKDHYFKHSPYGPIEDRVNFTGLNYYPPDPAYRYVLPLQRADEPELLTFQTSTGDEQTYHRLGTVEFEVEGQSAQLAIYQSTDHDGLFLPFRDATSGKETYGAGRYLEPHELGDGKLLIDFNLAYNPFCAYSEAYSCPLPPFENHLTTVAIRAGERMYKKPDINSPSG